MSTYERWDSNCAVSTGRRGTPRKGSVFIISESGYHELYQALCLQDEKVEVHPCRDALDAFKNSGIDIVLIDCAYNVRNCLRLVMEIKAAASDVPIIFLSEDNSKDTLLDAFRAGARLFLGKPVNIIEFKGMVTKLLGIKRTTRERRVPFTMDDTAEPRGVERAATSDKPVNILKVIQYIEDNFSEKISLERLAQEASLSKYHFCRFFFKYTGMSPMRFVTIMRIERAKEFLKRQDQTVSVVSVLTGYNDLGTFIRQFKNITGLTPAAYQESVSIAP